MEDCDVAPLKPRERIISTARDLFRKHGIRGIGVDAIADVAGTNKMTLSLLQNCRVVVTARRVGDLV